MIQVTIVTQREVPEKALTGYLKRLQYTGVPKEVLAELLQHGVAVWRSPEDGVATTYRIEKEPK